jgi:hypothetical protein
MDVGPECATVWSAVTVRGLEAGRADGIRGVVTPTRAAILAGAVLAFSLLILVVVMIKEQPSASSKTRLATSTEPATAFTVHPTTTTTLPTTSSSIAPPPGQSAGAPGTTSPAAQTTTSQAPAHKTTALSKSALAKILAAHHHGSARKTLKGKHHGNKPTGKPKLPGAPTNVTAVAGSHSATISWTAPSSNGVPIVGYIVYRCNSSGVCINSVTFHNTKTTEKIGGLLGGDPETFKVAALTASGTGPKSAPSNAVTPTK